jgi:RNA-binding protein
LRVGDRDLRDRHVDELCAKGGAELIQRIGNIALVYRENPEHRRIRVPSA